MMKFLTISCLISLVGFAFGNDEPNQECQPNIPAYLSNNIPLDCIYDVGPIIQFDKIKKLLNDWHLSQFANAFWQNGFLYFEDWEDLLMPNNDNKRLFDIIGMKTGHAALFRRKYNALRYHIEYLKHNAINNNQKNINQQESQNNENIERREESIESIESTEEEEECIEYNVICTNPGNEKKDSLDEIYKSLNICNNYGKYSAIEMFKIMIDSGFNDVPFLIIPRIPSNNDQIAGHFNTWSQWSIGQNHYTIATLKIE